MQSTNELSSKYNLFVHLAHSRCASSSKPTHADDNNNKRLLLLIKESTLSPSNPLLGFKCMPLNAYVRFYFRAMHAAHEVNSLQALLFPFD